MAVSSGWGNVNEVDAVVVIILLMYGIGGNTRVDEIGVSATMSSGSGGVVGVRRRKQRAAWKAVLPV